MNTVGCSWMSGDTEVRAECLEHCSVMNIREHFNLFRGHHSLVMNARKLFSLVINVHGHLSLIRNVHGYVSRVRNVRGYSSLVRNVCVIMPANNIINTRSLRNVFVTCLMSLLYVSGS